jgi:hypothetical protein
MGGLMAIERFGAAPHHSADPQIPLCVSRPRVFHFD